MEVTEGMGMLKSITLENYKSYRDETEIKIKPLTVLCGVNSSGKSAILKSLLMMKQSVENSKSNGEITYNGEYVNNGKFNTLAYNHEKEIVITNRFEISIDSYADISAYKNLYRATFHRNINRDNAYDYRDFPFEVSFGVYVREEVVIKYDIKINHAELSKPIAINIMMTNESTCNIVFNGMNFKSGTSFKNDSVRIFDCFCSFDGIKIISLYTNNPPFYIDVSEVFNYIYVIFKNIGFQFSNNIQHIAPLRYSPSRYYIADEVYDSVGISGEYTVPILKKYSDTKIPNVIPPVNGKVCETKKKELVTSSINKWLNYLGVDNYDIPMSQNAVLQLLIGKQSITDVGFGVSQILPILTQGLIMQPYQTLLLEQPEIHLHPKAQMGMADFLLSLAINNQVTIVETHSDHIIHRITRRVMESYKTDNDLSELVKIYFVSKDENGISQINKGIEIDPFKGLVNCPPEFFDQYGYELRDIMKQAYVNLNNN